MLIELVVVPECPQEAPAAALLRSALNDIGLQAVSFQVRTVDSPAVAQEIGFVGSPTFMAQGRDLFEEPGRAAAVACRLYPGGQVLPSVDELRRHLKEAAAAAAAAR